MTFLSRASIFLAFGPGREVRMRGAKSRVSFGRDFVAFAFIALLGPVEGL
jgi:hypothetical protein